MTRFPLARRSIAIGFFLDFSPDERYNVKIPLQLTTKENITMSDALQKIAMELRVSKSESWSEQAEQRFESILSRFRIDLDAAIEATYAALTAFAPDEALVYNTSGRAVSETKRQILGKLLQANPALERIAYDALTDLEESAGTKDSESILGRFQIAGLELLREVEDIASAAPGETESEDAPSPCALTEQPFTIEG